MDQITAIDEFNNCIRQIYIDQQLTSLRGTSPDPDDHWLHGGVNMVTKYFTVAPMKAGFDRMSVFDDLTELSDQIAYFTAHVFLYVQDVNNPLDYGVQPPGFDRVIYLNYQNLAAKRYNFYVDIVAEKLYAYWTRLAHLLNAYLPKQLKTHAVDFSRVIDRTGQLLPLLHSNPAYIWLKSFKDNEQGSLNRERSVIVHHISTATAFQNAYRPTDRQELEELMVERLAYPELYKKHIGLSLEALNKTLDLIAEITTAPAITQPPIP